MDTQGEKAQEKLQERADGGGTLKKDFENLKSTSPAPTRLTSNNSRSQDTYSLLIYCSL